MNIDDQNAQINMQNFLKTRNNQLKFTNIIIEWRKKEAQEKDKIDCSGLKFCIICGNIIHSSEFESNYKENGNTRERQVDFCSETCLNNALKTWNLFQCQKCNYIFPQINQREFFGFKLCEHCYPSDEKSKTEIEWEKETSLDEEMQYMLKIYYLIKKYDNLNLNQIFTLFQIEPDTIRNPSLALFQMMFPPTFREIFNFIQVFKKMKEIDALFPKK